MPPTPLSSLTRASSSSPASPLWSIAYHHTRNASLLLTHRHNTAILPPTLLQPYTTTASSTKTTGIFSPQNKPQQRRIQQKKKKKQRKRSRGDAESAVWPDIGNQSYLAKRYVEQKDSEKLFATFIEMINDIYTNVQQNPAVYSMRYVRGQQHNICKALLALLAEKLEHHAAMRHGTGKTVLVELDEQIAHHEAQTMYVFRHLKELCGNGKKYRNVWFPMPAYEMIRVLSFFEHRHLEQMFELYQMMRPHLTAMLKRNDLPLENKDKHEHKNEHKHEHVSSSPVAEKSHAIEYYYMSCWNKHECLQCQYTLWFNDINYWMYSAMIKYFARFAKVDSRANAIVDELFQDLALAGKRDHVDKKKHQNNCFFALSAYLKSSLDAIGTHGESMERKVLLKDLYVPIKKAKDSGLALNTDCYNIIIYALGRYLTPPAAKEECKKIYDEMLLSSQTHPDTVTFVSLLASCRNREGRFAGDPNREVTESSMIDQYANFDNTDEYTDTFSGEKTVLELLKDRDNAQGKMYDQDLVHFYVSEMNRLGVEQNEHYLLQWMSIMTDINRTQLMLERHFAEKETLSGHDDNGMSSHQMDRIDGTFQQLDDMEKRHFARLPASSIFEYEVLLRYRTAWDVLSQVLHGSKNTGARLVANLVEAAVKFILFAAPRDMVRERQLALQYAVRFLAQYRTAKSRNYSNVSQLLNVHPYNILLLECVRQARDLSTVAPGIRESTLPLAYTLLEMIMNDNIETNETTTNVMLSLYKLTLHINGKDENIIQSAGTIISVIEHLLMHSDTPPKIEFVTSAMSFFASEAVNDVDRMMLLFDKLRSNLHIYQLDAHAFSVVLRALGKNNRIEDAMAIYRDMRQVYGVKPNQYCQEVLVFMLASRLQKLNTVKHAVDEAANDGQSFTKMEGHMSSEDIEEEWEKLIQHGLYFYECEISSAKKESSLRPYQPKKQHEFFLMEILRERLKETQ